MTGGVSEVGFAPMARSVTIGDVVNAGEGAELAGVAPRTLAKLEATEEHDAGERSERV